MAVAIAGQSAYVSRTSSPNVDSRRESYTSTSGGSFQTAPTALSHAGSRSSLSSNDSFESVNTVAAVNRRGLDKNLNPLHSLSQTPNGREYHVLRVTRDKVEMHNGPPPESLLRKTGTAVARAFPSAETFTYRTDEFGPPPPSPPASDEHVMEPPSPSPIHRTGPLSSEHSSSSGASRLTFESSPGKVSFSSPDRQGGRTTLEINGVNGEFQTKPSLKHSSSAETRGSIRTTTTASSHRIPRSSQQVDEASQISELSYPERTHGPKGATVSADGYLQPPLIVTHRPARRNTTGSAQTSLSKRPSRQLTGNHTHHHSSTLSRPATFDEGDSSGTLDSDILHQADQIRRERLSRKKAQQEAEAALTRATDQTRVLVGNLIGEGHVNYVLMYNMLTGIRIGVSRCQAKIKRPLKEEDFSARHKYSFDIVGNELTPSAKYDFKFKDYAPWVFRELREDYFGLDPADYLLSLTAKYILSELGSPGKSGSFFYFSRDYRFIIKTIHHTEHKFLRSILKQYYEHVKSNPHTLLSRFYGLHRVKLPRGRKIHFVIMNNLFPPHRDVHETYDLKGSTVGREYPEDKAVQNPRATLKDLNWINRNKSLELGPEKRALLTEQLRRDSELLKQIHVMDYSLLIGIHNMQRGNRDNLRSNTLKVFSPEVPLIRRKPTSIHGQSPEAIAMRKAMRESDPKRLGADSLSLPEEAVGDRQQFIFYQDEGGLRATDETNRPMDTIYYLGVIDILTPYNIKKRAEHLWKGLSADIHKISPVPPAEYGNRFFDFMKAIMRGGGGAERFKSE